MTTSLPAVNPKRLITFVLVVATLLVAGCGEKEEPSTAGPVVTQTTTSGSTTTGGTTTQPENDEQAIAGVVTDFLTDAEAPGACTKLVTPQFVKRSYGNVKGCEAARKPSAMAKSVAIQSAGGNGSTVTAKPKGGVFGGEKLEVTLINLDGQWKIDRITSNAKVGP